MLTRTISPAGPPAVRRPLGLLALAVAATAFTGCEAMESVTNALDGVTNALDGTSDDLKDANADLERSADDLKQSADDLQESANGLAETPGAITGSNDPRTPGESQPVFNRPGS